MNKRVFIVVPGTFILLFGACNTISNSRNPSGASAIEASIDRSGSLEQSSESELLEVAFAPAADPQGILFTLEAVDINSGEALDLEMDLIEISGGIAYRIILGNRIYTGNAEIIWEGTMSIQTIQWIKLFRFLWVENPGGISDPVMEIQNTGNGFVLQNYGNAMNIYQVFPLDFKYIYFLPKQNDI